MATKLASFCERRGYGLWLGDLRPGHAQGNWFLVQEHNEVVSREFQKGRRGEVGKVKVERVLPVTFVGPARVGSTNAILSLLRCASGLGVVGCAITALDDLAFVHLQLTAPGAATLRGDSGDPGDDGGMTDRLSRIVTMLGEKLQMVENPDGQEDERAPLTRLIDRAGDYQVFSGPVVEIQGRPPGGRRPLWFSWRRSGPDAGWWPAFTALQAALRDCDLWVDGVTDLRQCANFEYMLCRAVGDGAYSAKGKLTVPEKLLVDGNAAVEYAATKLCVRVEAAWRARLAEESVTGLQSMSFAWREHYLGNSRTR